MKNAILILLMLITIHEAFAVEPIRHCEKVLPVMTGSKQWKAINSLIKYQVNKFQTSEIKVTQIRVLNNIDEWYIADVSFDKLDPAIFVLKRIKNKFQIIEELSGDLREEGEPKQTIYEYFIEKVPKAPSVLFYCSAPLIAKNW